MVRELVKHIHESADKVKNHAESVPDVDVRRTFVAQCYDGGKIGVHLHFRGQWSGESEEADLCAVFERTVVEPGLDDTRVVCRQSKPCKLNSGGNDCDEFVFVVIVKVTAPPQRVFHWTETTVRLRFLDQCLGVTGQPAYQPLPIISESQGVGVDRKLRTGVGRIVSSKGLGQLPRQVVKGGPGIVHTVANHGTPLILREWLGNHDVKAAFRPVCIELDGDWVGLTFEKESDLLFKNFQMIVCPIDF